MSYEDLLIQNENQYGPKFVLITDGHRAHIRGHLSNIYKPRMLLHVLQHVKLYLRARQSGIPTINIEDILRAVEKRACENKESDQA